MLMMIFAGAVILGVIMMRINRAAKIEKRDLEDQNVKMIYSSLLDVCHDVKERTRMWFLLLDVDQKKYILDLLVEPKKAISCKQEEYIPVNRVLAKPWHDMRLILCISELIKGTTAPRIEVYRYWLYDEPWYVIKDGNHRTIAARLMNRERIKAYVIDEKLCIPETRYIDTCNGKFWTAIPEANSDKAPEKINVSKDPNIQNALIDMGVKTSAEKHPRDRMIL